MKERRDLKGLDPMATYVRVQYVTLKLTRIPGYYYDLRCLKIILEIHDL
jgi:hypothetical protein